MKTTLFFIPLFLFGCSSLNSQSALIAEKKDVATARELEKEISPLIQKVGAKNTLVVFDIDNTILQNNIALGSEQWFYWQEGLLKSNSAQKVADSFSGLLRVQGLLFELDPMKLTDEGLDEVIDGLQKQGAQTIVLTSRGSEFRNATERTLLNKGIDFSKTKIGTDLPGTFLPYQLETLSAEDKQLVGHRAPLPTSYANGIFMTSGQHKGLMLKQLLKRFSLDLDLIVFVDNHDKQVSRVYDAFKGKENVAVYRYSGMDKTYERFNSDAEHTKADAQWKKLKASLESMYGTTF